MKKGYKVVLTADRTLMSEYQGGIFMGFSACVPRGIIPDVLYFSLFSPSIGHTAGIVKAAPLGLRKIEAALLEKGFNEKEIVTAHPEHLDRVIGSETQILGISAMDPLGIGPASSTFSKLWEGESYMLHKFREIMRSKVVLKHRHHINIVVGGSGAWQLADERIRHTLDIDYVVNGEGEDVVPELFKDILNNTRRERIIEGKVVEDTPCITKPTICGVVEITRGCGRGCEFCIPTMLSHRSMPLNKIMKEIAINKKGGGKYIVLHGEDVFRYKAEGLIPNKKQVVELFENAVKGAGYGNISISHLAFSTIYSAPELAGEVSEILHLGSREIPFIGTQIGLETGSPKLISDHMKGKVKPFKPHEWPSVVERGIGICNDSHIVPVTTLILGIPGETDDDIIKTIELLDDIDDSKYVPVPLLFVPLGKFNGGRFCEKKDLNEIHWQLIYRCAETFLKKFEVLYPDYARMAGHGAISRTAISLLARYGKKKTRDYMRSKGYDPDH
jgi:radical SAM superfamily enzyme YgiQ (UPF0313 family)